MQGDSTSCGSAAHTHVSKRLPSPNTDTTDRKTYRHRKRFRPKHRLEPSSRLILLPWLLITFINISRIEYRQIIDCDKNRALRKLRLVSKSTRDTLPRVVVYGACWCDDDGVSWGCVGDECQVFAPVEFSVGCCEDEADVVGDIGV